MEAVCDNRRTAVRSGHSVGKTMTAAILAEWWFSARGNCVLTTAPSSEQVKELLWRQIRTNRVKAKRRLPGRPLQTGEIKVDTRPDWWARGFSTDKPERAQGKHEVNMLIIVDEAAGIPEWLWDALDSSMASEGVRMLIIGNPSPARGRFYHAFHEHSALWYPIHVKSTDSPNVTGKEPPVPGLATKEWVEEKKIEWGEDSERYQNKVLGNFPPDTGSKVCPMDWIRGAQELSPEPSDEIVSACLDVAGWGKDQSSLSYMTHNSAYVERVWGDKSSEGLMNTAKYTAKWIRGLENKPKRLVIDVDAVGAGVYSRVCEIKKQNPDWFGRCRIVKLHWGGKPDDPKRFCCRIDELYWRLREAIDPSKPEHERLALPKGTNVAAQLNLRKWSEDLRGRVKVESKKDLKKRKAKSPDIADSLAGLFHRPKEVKFAVL